MLVNLRNILFLFSPSLALARKCEKLPAVVKSEIANTSNEEMIQTEESLEELKKYN